MRTIKFRAWDKMLNRFTNHINDWKVMELNFNSEYIVQEFTGLLDKNGKEIYDGDIVLSPNYDYDPSNGDNPNLINEVYHRHAFFTYDGSPMDKDECGENVEIIGNVFENHNLLTK